MIGEMGVLLPSLEVGDEGWEEDIVDGDEMRGLVLRLNCKHGG